VTVRVIEYWVTVEGQHVPELFCLVTSPAVSPVLSVSWRRPGQRRSPG